MNTQEYEEEILRVNPNRFSQGKIKHHDLFKEYKRLEAVFWTVEEVDLSDDRKDWESLNEKEQSYIERILGFFATADGIVNENISTNFLNEVQCVEARYFYTFQASSEVIHSEMYALLIDTYIKNEKRQEELHNAIENDPFVKKKAEWAMKWFDRENPFAERIIAFACVEGIFFSSSFASIFWLKKRGLMPGLCFSNELISRDEALHCNFACLIYNKLSRKLTQEKIYQIFSSAVELEIEFVKDCIPSELIGMNSSLMSQYIKFIADFWLVKLNYEKLYNVENPFDFMDMISLEGKTNFFEKVNSSYSKFGVGSKKEEMVFSLNEEF